ncbi:efflux RND transporter periplasmic adaptor subunit [Photobacterium sp. DNB23_23_1]|uniref:Efflux RND transporter periplasmic adaptor subunit n=1 Tax=Photobacterium pectinilyticum TaxID=2906793 RepID=A0ABT1N2Q4_9GAMM|nr:efflux RND transporter periplasmic adaptor subunit [Photobacterium sp. ZSDE20]MCQ1058031.1 efflux RND transporter periplasmic adaptor subunit [Photobacterium sp. ZSDE20]MDD1822564.1 efflux RND transporter periplasmic adaptor subunit [Photobacterium sp. ZSDE20]
MYSVYWFRLITFLLFPLLVACNDVNHEPEYSSPLGLTQPDESDSIYEPEPLVIASGTLKPVGEVEVGSEVSGRIIELLVDFNDVVQKGQTIARIDPKFFEAQIRQAEASLLNAKALVAMKKASLRQSIRSLKRIKALNKRKAVSQNSLEEAETNVWVAEAELEQALAVVISHEAELEEARVTLSRTEILAPIDGVVLSREVMSGQTVAASLEAPKLFKIAHTLNEMEIHARIDEADIGQIRTGQKAEFTVPAYGDRRFKAIVEQIRVAPLVVDNVVTYTVVLSAENNGDSLLPGMTAVVEITTDETSDSTNASYTSRIEESMTSGWIR